MIPEKDIPSEVYEAMCIGSLSIVGMELYNRYQEIVKKYPEHFPWETKYNSIPSEVHEAYAIERDGGTYEQLMAKAIENPIAPVNHVSIDLGKPFDFREAFSNILKMENERRDKQIEREKRDIIIWDRHYSKYNLKFRLRYRM